MGAGPCGPVEPQSVLQSTKARRPSTPRACPQSGQERSAESSGNRNLRGSQHGALPVTKDPGPDAVALLAAKPAWAMFVEGRLTSGGKEGPSVGSLCPLLAGTRASLAATSLRSAGLLVLPGGSLSSPLPEG
ncbi:hypothetical protein H1C71_027058 [Ictidomys tridecemlineatus]|nr:hypothetical protein H1C71_027058 [Ictidomys tridecemlineatus]KAG3290596.1 hypothetical protein H1C71_027058 [Ictidomys tridecemlineatus]